MCSPGSRLLERQRLPCREFLLEPSCGRERKKVVCSQSLGEAGAGGWTLRPQVDELLDLATSGKRQDIGQSTRQLSAETVEMCYLRAVFITPNSWGI